MLYVLGVVVVEKGNRTVTGPVWVEVMEKGTKDGSFPCQRLDSTRSRVLEKSDLNGENAGRP